LATKSTAVSDVLTLREFSFSAPGQDSHSFPPRQMCARAIGVQDANLCGTTHQSPRLEVGDAHARPECRKT
jgi:hypothetical protein